MAIHYIGSVESPPVMVPIEKLGSPGIRGEIYILAQLSGDTRSDQIRLNDTSERQFKIFALLQKTPNPTDNIRGDFSQNDGGSYLLLPEAAVQVNVATPWGSFIIKANSHRELSLIEFECTSISISHARWMFLQAVMPFVDYVSYITHSPLFIAQLRIEDIKNNCITILYVSPYVKQIVPSADKLYLEMNPVYAMYREALNSSSDFYKFLCYYKILEGLLGPLRINAAKKLKSLGLKISIPKEVVPNSPELPLDHQGYIGKPIKQFFDKVLRLKYRTAVAHFMKTDDGSILHVGQPAHIDEYSNIILICELCVRKVIADHESLLKMIDR